MGNMIVNIGDLLPKVTRVVSILRSKNVMPILSSLLVEPFDGSLFITGSDGDLRLTEKLSITDCTCTGKKFCVEGNDFLKAIKNLQGPTIDVDFDDEKHKMTIKSGKARIQLPFKDGSEYPVMKNEKADCPTLDASSSVLYKVISKSIIAVSDDPLRPMLCGVKLTFDKDMIECAAANRLSLIVCREENLEKSNVGSFVLPSRVAKLLLSILSSYDGIVRIEPTESNVVISTKFTKLFAVVSEGKYPDYNRVIPQKNDVISLLDKQELEYAIKCALSMSADNRRVCLKFSEDNVNISAEDIEVGKGSTTDMKAKNAVPREISIGFNGNVLLELIHNIEEDFVAFELKNERSSALLRAGDESLRANYVSIIMPMA